jgi:hypothetical protein
MGVKALQGPQPEFPWEVEAPSVGMGRWNHGGCGGSGEKLLMNGDRIGQFS